MPISLVVPDADRIEAVVPGRQRQAAGPRTPDRRRAVSLTVALIGLSAYQWSPLCRKKSGFRACIALKIR
jgi:hypothetical protein